MRDGRHVSGDVPRPAGAGGGADAIRFVQWTGRAFHSRRVARDAIPTPPLSTPARRLQARTIAATFAGAAKALHAAKPAVNRSMERYERRLGRCPDLVERADQRVVSSLRGLASEGALLRPVKPQLDALERLELEDPILGAGRDAWDAAVRRHRPWPEPDLCTVLRRWSATRFDVARAPVAPDAYDTSELTVELAGTPAVVAGAARLRELGAGRAAEEAFAGGLLDVADMMGED